MEIRFSSKAHPANQCVFVHNAAEKFGVFANIGKVHGRAVRFQLHDGFSGTVSTEDYDNVIRALLNLDPDATIRTARAVYEGLADFEAQYKVRKQT